MTSRNADFESVIPRLFEPLQLKTPASSNDTDDIFRFDVIFTVVIAIFVLFFITLLFLRHVIFGGGFPVAVQLKLTSLFSVDVVFFGLTSKVGLVSERKDVNVMVQHNLPL